MRLDQLNEAEEPIMYFGGDYAFLSNFYPSPVTVDGIHFSTVEHAYQAAKTNDLALKQQIAAKETPGKAKRAGGARGIIKGPLFRPDWEEVKVAVMTELVRQKFQSHPDLAQRLLATGNAELAEGNTWGDRFWGISGGQGENWLGKILMSVRNELRS